MSGVLDRTLAILEMLADAGQGVALARVASDLNMPKSAAHRLLTDLVRTGYVRQLGEQGEYILTTKLVSLGLGFLGKTGVVELAQPLLDQLAQASGELVRLAVVDGDNLTWVAKSQGARQGLRYDPDMGGVARLSCSSSGWAWLMAMSEDQALALLARQGVGLAKDYGPQAPADLQAVLGEIRASRQRGYAITQETYTPGLNAMAVPVQRVGQSPVGTLSIAGPAARLTPTRMAELVDPLQHCAQQLAVASGALPFLGRQQPTGSRRLYGE